MSFAIFTAAELQQLASGAEFSKLFRAQSERYWMNIVTKDRAPKLISEMHDQEADIYVVIEGEADLYLGGTIIEQNSPSPGQHLGFGLEGAECRHIAKGDVIVIPEGVPHMLDARNSRIVYLVIKEDVTQG